MNTLVLAAFAALAVAMPAPVPENSPVATTMAQPTPSTLPPEQMPHINWYSDSNCGTWVEGSELLNWTPPDGGSLQMSESPRTPGIKSALSVNLKGLYTVKYQSGQNQPTDFYQDGQCFSGDDLTALIGDLPK